MKIFLDLLNDRNEINSIASLSQCSPLSSLSSRTFLGHKHELLALHIFTITTLTSSLSNAEKNKKKKPRMSWKIYIFMSENNCRLESLIVYLHSSNTWMSGEECRERRKEIPRSESLKKLVGFTIGSLSKLRTRSND